MKHEIQEPSIEALDVGYALKAEFTESQWDFLDDQDEMQRVSKLRRETKVKKLARPSFYSKEA